MSVKETIHIYHTNDYHSHFENWPRVAQFLKERKAYHEAMKEDVFIFDIGDFVDRWHPFTESTMGKGNIALLNDVGYTAVTIGNNEGITLPHNGLDELYTDANFDVIVANLYYPNRKRPRWALPHQIYETKQGTKIGVIAVTAYYKKLYELLGWDLSEPLTELEIQINRLKDKTDMIILLSHLGIYDDEKIAGLYPNIDLILGGHTHHILHTGKQVNRTTLAAAGKYGQYAGYVKAIKKQDMKVEMDASLMETIKLPSVCNEENIIKSYAEIGKKKLNSEVTIIPEPLSFDWSYPSQLPQILCEAIHEWCDADCTLINSGLVLRPLQRGKVTKYDLHQMLPHPINPCTVELTGAELKEIILHAESDHWPELKVIGLGFRGEVMGKFIYRGIEINRSKLDATIAGKSLEPDKIYKLGTIDMFTFGKFFPEIQRSERKEYYMPEFLRDVMEWKLKKLYGPQQ
ncbi:bifunctional metallophosphatase/5'-nucleotidase [Lederbergia lenta]|uniref:Metallophosphoesterase n=1 Tax=Lederbergia lenta TaxID=1467 RepID=A0A2X4WBT1_LEDLE|nr:bifunctional UDP-sugar hydrolase/5'-nucleotidase [Lederbergia lenta]MCM3112958.1 bifunctional metallophosphatase/5'-nucleotidase [Lederbergia lenta]MEC2326653.1 bifunctional UDP-sugar hydrolase/5'-nucleotidase [Lederbergia lenta]SQI61616.1 metallophosphoesterase [Lederbergia lenta]